MSFWWIQYLHQTMLSISSLGAVKAIDQSSDNRLINGSVDTGLVSDLLMANLSQVLNAKHVQHCTVYIEGERALPAKLES